MIRLSLQRKLFLALALVGIAPLAVLGVLSIYSLNKFHQADVASIENNLLNQKKSEINDSIERILSTLQLTVGFEQISDIELSQQHYLLEQFQAEIPALREISFVSASGQETAMRTMGVAVAAEELLDQSENEKFHAAKAGENYLSPIFYTLEGPAVTVSTPVRNRNGVVISVLTGKVALFELQDIVEQSYLGETGYLYLVDGSGTLVAHSGAGLLDGVGIDRIVMPERERYHSFWGEEVVASRQSLERLGLTLVAEWPVREADAVVSTVRNQMLMFSGIILLSALAMSAFLTLRIVRPIRILEQGTVAVAQGKFDQPVTIKTGDEIEDLGAAFNKMMAGLKRLDELKEEFVFVAAHELRTPVTAIKWYLNMILEEEGTQVKGETKEMFDEVIAANDRLVQLVEDLLQVARSEAGRLTIAVAAMDIRPVIEQVLKELAPLAAQKGLKLIYEPPQSLPQVMADADRLNEVLVNLIGNSIKYTLSDAGPVHISHSLENGMLVTSVTDNGIGIPLDAQKKLFEKFFRVQTKQTAQITGTGLGLFIVKQIVEKMNGRIWMKSEQGKGSTFSFSLKAAS